MAYIFISYAEHLTQGARNKAEFYNLSLEEQFEILERRIPESHRTGSFRTFIDACFPSALLKKFYISCPNFLRDRKISEDGKPSYLNNVVLRPELTLSMRRYLPDNQNVILIGDISEGQKMKKFVVKGIQFIDESMSSPNDLAVRAQICSNFENNSRTWSVSGIDWNDTVFTPNFVAEIIDFCYTVENPAEVRKTYDLWNQYMDFRKYYLDEQSKRNFHLDSATYIESYAVNRKDYRKNSSIYDDYILDNVEDFKKSDMVVLSSQIEDAEPFPLIRLNIDRNKKQFLEATTVIRGRKVNEEEKRIRSLASDNVFITEKDPQSKSDYRDRRTGEYQKISFGEMINAGYTLGDRFRVVSFDIEPTEHLNQLEQEHEHAVDRIYKNIDAKYQKIIEGEVKTACDAYQKSLEKEKDSAISQREKELNESLAADVENNKDESINSLIKQQRKTIETKLKSTVKQAKKESDEDYKAKLDSALNEAFEQIDVKALYISRNNKIISDLNSQIDKRNKTAFDRYKSQKQNEITNKYKSDIRNEKIAEKERLDANLEADKNKVIEEETIKRFSLYFRLGDPNGNIKNKDIETISKCQYIVYDPRAEEAKIKRQRMALDNFYGGYVKNPYLSTYLFTPETLDSVTPEPSTWIWYLESLNEKQKEAVRKAVSSNGIFLLQGPPGTGKTQVIAEVVAQLVKKDKKVLISSETHKAIDNVFERLPKIAEIVPVRLIPSSNSKKSDNEYDPKFLVDNFYLNISSRMKKSVERYRNFKKNKEEFSETFDKLKLLKSKIERKQKVLDEANKKIREYDAQAKRINEEISALKDREDDVRIELDILRRTKRHIENDNLRPDEDIKQQVIIDYRKALENILSKDIYNGELELGQLVKNIEFIKIDEAGRELAVINPDSQKTKLEIRRKEVKAEIDRLDEEYEYEIPEDLQEKYKALKREFISLKKQIESTGENTSANLKMNGIFKYQYLVENVDDIVRILSEIKDNILEIKGEYFEALDKDIAVVDEKFKSVQNEILAKRTEVKKANEQIIEIQNDNEVTEINENKFELENKLIQFFKDFEISEPFSDVDEGLKIIKRKWDELETDFIAKEEENKEKIPVYEKIAKYLSMDEVIEEDRRAYTKTLFENANVFGITCTSSDRFSERNVDALSEYNIDGIDLKTVGIDVVIIDEVSKSSFIDLLIPILYGKTVILVGDHRQLPPMYEFAKLRDEDFDGLNPEIINRDINKKFTALYEECFFKTLFEKIPDSYKTMLVQQYRCHEQIMNVFNHFYQGQLKLGWDGQNNAKKHNISIISNGRSIIEPSKHIYFVDCKKNETHEQDSTSMYNTGEALVVTELIKKLNTFFKQNPERDKLSIGVICTYGDQARKIKETLKSEKVKTDAFKTDVEKMIVSTVDDFQGDERDIIILSMVRNPENPNRSDPGFILKYQRVNVALSRARRLLIMVGNRRYLETKGLIDLPDVNGNSRRDRKDFRIYEEIISTIEQYGKVLDDVDVIDDKEARING